MKNQKTIKHKIQTISGQSTNQEINQSNNQSVNQKIRQLTSD